MTTKDPKHDRLLRLADNIIAHGSGVTYPSRGAAQEVRNVVRELAAAIRASAVPPQDGVAVDYAKEVTAAEAFQIDALTKPELETGDWQTVDSEPDPDDLVARLLDHALFSKAERMAMFKEAATEIDRLRGLLATPPVPGAARALERAITQFEALRNAYKGYLPWGSDSADVSTRLKQIEDMDKAFFAAIRTLSGNEGGGK